MNAEFDFIVSFNAVQYDYQSKLIQLNNKIGLQISYLSSKSNFHNYFLQRPHAYNIRIAVFEIKKSR